MGNQSIQSLSVCGLVANGIFRARELPRGLCARVIETGNRDRPQLVVGGAKDTRTVTLDSPLILPDSVLHFGAYWGR